MGGLNDNRDLFERIHGVTDIEVVQELIQDIEIILDAQASEIRDEMLLMLCDMLERYGVDVSYNPTRGQK